MDIRRPGTLNHRLHHTAPFPLDDTIAARGALRTDEPDGRAHGNSPRCRQGSRTKLTTGSQAPRRTGVSRRPHKDPDFTHPRVPAKDGHGQLTADQDLLRATTLRDGDELQL